MLLPETGAAYSAPLSSSWLSELFSSVYSSGSCGRLYRSVGEKENPQPLADRSRSRPTAAVRVRCITCLRASSSLPVGCPRRKTHNLTYI